ncbi:hypothetical protein [Kitasatospora sp. NBC_01266]|uniref:hypothetical protein n=1 Tax=Kitasatospora sp. NBC_01266 TaxID=2903572 RepID=UPI002E326235|nr:hypothetical protein [Kitasatospora sp. NBC_01266]
MDQDLGWWTRIVLDGWQLRPGPGYRRIAEALAATRYGVLVAPGAAACVDGRHHHGVRLSFAEAPDILEAAVDRLAAAWEEHGRRPAASR